MRRYFYRVGKHYMGKNSLSHDLVYFCSRLPCVLFELYLCALVLSRLHRHDQADGAFAGRPRVAAFVGGADAKADWRTEGDDRRKGCGGRRVEDADRAVAGLWRRVM
jgi:hypothetical protein